MPHRNVVHRARTVAQIRQLAAVASPRAARRRVPRQVPPDLVALSYFEAIRPVCEATRAHFRTVEPEVLRLLILHRRGQGKMDAAGHDIAARRLVDAAAERAADAFAPRELHEVAKKFGRRTTDHNKEQLSRQIEAAVGVPYSAIERPVRDKVEGWAALNVDLIRTVPDRYFDRLRLDVEAAFSEGTHPDELAEQFQDRYGMAEDDARRIARDQVGKLNADVNQDRQESLGVTRFIWRTMNDQRVRPEHEDLEGEEFEWSAPPVVEGEEATPGTPILCRCYAEPVLDDILAALEE